MNTADRHLAHFNWATLRGDWGSEVVAGFQNAVEKVNALADRSPSFVWRYAGDEATAAARIGWPMFVENSRIIASFSVWQAPGAFEDYVLKTVHGAFRRRSDEWFEPATGVNVALWWVPVGHTPSVSEAREKVETLQSEGPSETVFTFADLRSLA